MSKIEERAEDAEAASTERLFKFVLTLFVATLIVAVTTYVLGSAMLDPRANGTAHRSAVAMLHVHS